jgi:hypothetical protein
MTNWYDFFMNGSNSYRNGEASQLSVNQGNNPVTGKMTSLRSVMALMKETRLYCDSSFALISLGKIRPASKSDRRRVPSSSGLVGVNHCIPSKKARLL